MNRQACFNEWANTWDEKFCTPRLASFLEGFISKFGIENGQNVLDVGSGTGVLIPFLLKVIGQTGSITAIDYSEKMVAICKSKYSGLKNVNVELQNVENLVFTSESFDAITCFGLFPHLENKEKALFQMNRVLKPEGRLIIAHAIGSAEIKSHHGRSASVIANDVLPEEKEMKKLLEKTGFTRVYIKDEPNCYLCLSTKPLHC